VAAAPVVPRGLDVDAVVAGGQRGRLLPHRDYGTGFDCLQQAELRAAEMARDVDCLRHGMLSPHTTESSLLTGHTSKDIPHLDIQHLGPQFLAASAKRTDGAACAFILCHHRHSMVPRTSPQSQGSVH
jgi:hypothetical protein